MVMFSRVLSSMHFSFVHLLFLDKVLEVLYASCWLTHPVVTEHFAVCQVYCLTCILEIQWWVKQKNHHLSRSIYPLYADFPPFVIVAQPLLPKLQMYCVPSFWMFSTGFPVGSSDFIRSVLKAPSGMGETVGWSACASARSISVGVLSSIKPPWTPVFSRHSLSLQVVPHPHPVTGIRARFLPPLLATSLGPQLACPLRQPTLVPASCLRAVLPKAGSDYRSLCWKHPVVHPPDAVRSWLVRLTLVLASACFSFFANSCFIWIWTAYVSLSTPGSSAPLSLWFLLRLLPYGTLRPVSPHLEPGTSSFIYSANLWAFWRVFIYITESGMQ